MPSKPHAPTARSRAAFAGLFAVTTLIAAAPTSGEEQPGVAPSPSGEGAHDAEIRQVLVELERARGVPATAAVAAEELTRDALRARLDAVVERELPAEYRVALDRFALAFGLVEPGESQVELTLQLLTAQIAGYYDNETQTFAMLDDLPEAALQPVLVHELFHAIQDQRWGIDRLVDQRRWITDSALAVQSLLEGDAMAAMFGVSVGSVDQLSDGPVASALLERLLAGAADEMPDGVPSALWEQTLFPYTGGTPFVIELARRRGWEAVDSLYDAPPQSTEQVLHVDRFLSGDEPTWIDYVADVPDGRRYLVDILGEAGGGSTLAQLAATSGVARSACDRALAGWDGDRLEAWAIGDDRDVVVWSLVWDSVEDASQFAVVAFALADTWLGADVRSGAAAGGHGAGEWAAAQSGVVWVEWWGDQALLVLDRGGTVTEAERWETVDRVVRSVWATQVRSRYPELQAERTP